MLKKQLLFWLIAVFGFSFLTAAALPAVKKGDVLTVEEVMRNVNSKTAEKIQNAKLVFEGEGAGMEFSRIIFWAAGDRGFRVDFVSASEISTICRKNKEFWGYEAKSGVFQLTDNEVEDIGYDMALCPFACFRAGVYKPLTPAGTGLLRDMQCRMYETSTYPGKPEISLEVWVDEASNLPQQIKMRSPNGFYAISYLDYQDFDGMKLATRINTATSRGTMKLKLVDVKWNSQFPDDIFVESDSGKNPQLLALQKRVAALTPVKATPVKPAKAVAAAPQVAAKPAAPVQAAVKTPVKKTVKLNTRAIIEVKNNIAKLDVLIGEKEKQQDELKQLIQKDRDQAMAITSSIAGTTRYRYRNSWYWGYYGGRDFTIRHKEDRSKKRLAKALYKESETAIRQSEKLEKELSELRLQRADANSMLERLQAGK